MIERARTGYYHDYLSPLATPEIQLVKDLRELAARPATPRISRPLLRALAQAVIDGEHDSSPEEGDEWARSPEGQETMGLLTRRRPRGYIDDVEAAGAASFRKHAPEPLAPGTPGADAVMACADLAGRTGAQSFECGYLNDDVPSEQAGWYASVMFKGARIIVEDKSSPAEACDALAVRILAGGQCQHCKGLVTLTDDGAFAYRSAVLTTGQRWDAEDAAQAPQCRWTQTGARWERGCA
jgi:hypothetical protein